MDDKATTRALQLAAEQGVVRPRDLIAHGVPHTLLSQLHKQGRLQRVSRGLYRLPDAPVSEHSSLVQACTRIPGGVICLLSALRFHNLGTQNPFEVWMAIHFKARMPKPDYPPLRIVRFSGAALLEGVEEHSTPDGRVRVFGVAKTVVDCFRYRNKIGLDVGLEALDVSLRERRATVDEIWRYARLLRMTNVLRPYLEARG